MYHGQGGKRGVAGEDGRLVTSFHLDDARDPDFDEINRGERAL